uniref:Putative ovule protein n=1 Tax=Solanum chacoense TaxID=4108 RepID=A0A0V0IAZ7_SOLCH
MKIVRGILRTANACLSRYSSHHRTFSALPNFAPDDKQSTNSFESAEDFERRIFGDSAGNSPSSNSFFRKLDRVEKAYDTSGLGSTFSSGKDLVY